MSYAAGLTEALASLRHRSFSWLWLALVCGNTAAFMRDLANAWIATGLISSPWVAALMQSATTLPVFLLAIPAGILSDVCDCRRLLIGAQVLLATVSATLLLLSEFSDLSVPWLLAMALLGGVGTALTVHTWLAVMPSLVPFNQVRPALTMNSLGINSARGLGSVVAGVLLAQAGMPMTYAATLFVSVLAVLLLLPLQHSRTELDPLKQQPFGALRAGIRYTRASHELHRVLWRSGLFFLSASAAWALLPLAARQISPDSTLYGLLQFSIGIGAVGGTLILAPSRSKLGADSLLLAMALLFASALVMLTWTSSMAVMLTSMFLLGASWIGALTTFGSTAHSLFPAWVRGRGLAVYLTALNGALTVGSVIWGGLADLFGVQEALRTAAVMLAITALLSSRRRLPATENEHRPGFVWPLPQSETTRDEKHGPVIVQVEYRVQEENRTEFLNKLRELGLVRRRDGAQAWCLAEDADDPERLVEWFFVDSWAEHLRQSRFGTEAAKLREQLLRMHAHQSPPTVKCLMTILD